MPQFEPSFGQPDPLFFRVPLALMLALWALWWCPLVALARRDNGKAWPVGLLLGLLGPIGLHLERRSAAARRAATQQTSAAAPAQSVGGQQAAYVHLWAWLAGTITVLLPTALVAGGFMVVGGRQGESLQVPVAVSLAVCGVIAGVVMGAIGRRVAFFEIMGVMWAFCAALLVANTRLEVFFNFGTTAVFLLTVGLTSLLILFVTMLLGGSLGFLAMGDGAFNPSFSYEAWIGRRYLLAKRRQSFISVITFISVAGVTVGVWAMLVVLSVMSGFEADLKTKILGANAHLIVQKAGGDFNQWQQAVEKIRNTRQVTGASPFVFNEVMISSDTNLTGALIKGVDPATMDQVSNLTDSAVEGRFQHLSEPGKIPDENTPLPEPGEEDIRKEPGPTTTPEQKKGGAPLPAFGITPQAVPEGAVLPGIAIGQEMARNLRVFVGDKITVVSPVAELGPTGPVPRARTFRVGAIFYTGMYEYDSKFAYIQLEESQKFFSLGNTVTGVEVKVDDIEATTRIGRDIVSQLGGYPYRTRDWKDMNRNLFAALKLEKIAMFIILAFIILVASFNILSTLIMVVLEKGKEIAILKSMGSTDASVMKIFVSYGLVIGLSGTVLGLILGFLSCKAIETFGIGLDPEVYYIANLPVQMDPVEFGLVAIAAMVISHLATVYPALQAARLRPVEGLRYE